MRKSTRSRQKPVDWQEAPDIKARVEKIIEDLELDWLHASSIYCLRSNYSSARAYARIWGMGRVWQIAIGLKPVYCIEVLSEKFDSLSQREKDRVILHELAHIPKNFSGALLPHAHGKGGFHDKLKQMEAAYNRKLR